VFSFSLLLPQQVSWQNSSLTQIQSSLERDPTNRATPWRMLEHPWMLEFVGKQVNVAKFLKKVWRWT